MDFRSHVAWVAVQTWSVANTYLPELDLDLYLTDVSLFVQVENVMRQLCTVFSSSGVRLARGPILALEVSVFIIHHVTPDSQIPKCTAKSVSIMYFFHTLFIDFWATQVWQKTESCANNVGFMKSSQCPNFTKTPRCAQLLTAAIC